ncbi:caspase, EACC1-associated type [Streptomyces sp. WG7]|uniref:caspase, EACC1-associated type n=1 Tax=Streptomyces sp. WG7 TaxID=3417650 RepID=UPI003CF3CDF7
MVNPDELYNELERVIIPYEGELILQSIGFPEGELPSNHLAARLYWSQVRRQIDLGVLADGEALLARAAHSEYPGNPVFHAAAQLPEPVTAPQQPPPTQSAALPDAGPTDPAAPATGRSIQGEAIAHFANLQQTTTQVITHFSVDGPAGTVVQVPGPHAGMPDKELLHRELRGLRERAQQARRGKGKYSVRQIVWEAQHFLPASATGGPSLSTVHRWLGPYDNFAVPHISQWDKLLAVISVMAEWAGEPYNSVSWLELLGRADRESRAETQRVMQWVSQRSLVGQQRVPTHLPCWQTGAAVLIGVSGYAEMPAVPSIANNLTSLEDLMANGLGIPRHSIFVVNAPSTTTEVHEAIEKASDAADPAGGALFIYFSGHGWTDRGRLLLGLVGSSRSRPWSALDFNSLRIQIADSQISSRVVILDSCYSGAALDVLGPDDLASAAAIDGTYVMTSANATTAALAPRSERFTAFTGQLIKALSDGIPGGPPVIDADALYRYAKRIARARGYPLPGRQIGGDGDLVGIMPNRWRGNHDRKD